MQSRMSTVQSRSRPSRYLILTRHSAVLIIAACLALSSRLNCSLCCCLTRVALCSFNSRRLGRGAGVSVPHSVNHMLVHSNLLAFSGGIIEMHHVGGEKMFVMKRLYHASPASSTLPQSISRHRPPVSFLLEL